MTLSAEDTLNLHLKVLKLPTFEREYVFHPTRKWRFDFAFIEQKLAVEVEGGLYTHGTGKKLVFNAKTRCMETRSTQSRHLTIKGFEDDCEKYNAAAALGWRLIRVTTKHVKSGVAANAVLAGLGMFEKTA